MNKEALLIIDMQNDYFPGGANELVGAEKASQNAKAILERFKRLQQTGCSHSTCFNPTGSHIFHSKHAWSGNTPQRISRRERAGYNERLSQQFYKYSFIRTAEGKGSWQSRYCWNDDAHVC